MTLQTKRRVDYWVGGLLLALLFPLVRLLGLTMRRDHSTAERKGCAVVKLVGAGSLFLAMPSMREIRAQFPAGRFYLVGSPAVVRVAREFGWFDSYWVIDDSSLFRLIVSTATVLWRMRRHCDHAIDLEVHSRFTTLLTVLSTVRNRIGFVDEIVFWRRGFYTHMTFFNVHGPVYVFYDLLAKWFGLDTVPVTAFNSGFHQQVLAAAMPEGLAPRAPFVAIGHACSDLSRERQLRPDEWKRLLQPVLLAGHEIVLLGGPGDAGAADEIVAALGRGANLCGRLSIVQSAQIVARASVYYGIDSMLLHLARAQGVAVVGIFGPTDPSVLLRPLGGRERVAFAKLPCAPCIHVNETPPCQGRRTCMALALDSLLHPSDQARASVPPVGWDVDPGASRVREISVACS